jgi:soluble lytic murein transglycosylase-like protein
LRHTFWILVLITGHAYAQVLQIDQDGSTHRVGPGWTEHADVDSQADRYAPAVQDAARKYNLSPLLLDTLAREESGYDPTALSPAGAIGIMQLMPATARELHVDPWDPTQNIFGGAAYLRQQIDHFNGNLEMALAAYNAGSARVIRFTGVPPYPQTRRYVGRALDRLAGWSLQSLPLPDADRPSNRSGANP